MEDQRIENEIADVNQKVKRKQDEMRDQERNQS
jgi:hypothetical protein